MLVVGIFCWVRLMIIIGLCNKIWISCCGGLIILFMICVKVGCWCCKVIGVVIWLIMFCVVVEIMLMLIRLFSMVLLCLVGICENSVSRVW